MAMESSVRTDEAKAHLLFDQHNSLATNTPPPAPAAKPTTRCPDQEEVLNVTTTLCNGTRR